MEAEDSRVAENKVEGEDENKVPEQQRENALFGAKWGDEGGQTVVAHERVNGNAKHDGDVVPIERLRRHKSCMSKIEKLECVVCDTLMTVTGLGPSPDVIPLAARAIMKMNAM